jgi:hypothetical protein
MAYNELDVFEGGSMRRLEKAGWVLRLFRLLSVFLQEIGDFNYHTERQWVMYGECEAAYQFLRHS